MHKNPLLRRNLCDVALWVLLVAPCDDVGVSVSRTWEMNLAHLFAPTTPKCDEASIERQRFAEAREPNTIDFARHLISDGSDRSQLRIVRDGCNINASERR